MGASTIKDFSARQIRASQLIASGGIAGTKAGLIVYSASNATNLRGAFPEKMLDDVGNDVYFFVSGSQSSKVARGDPGNGYAGVTLFGGDVVFSGTLYADRMVIEVDLSTTGSVLISGSLFVSRSITAHQGLTANQAYGSTSDHDVNFYGTQVGNTGFHWNADGADNGELFLGNDAVAVGLTAYGATSDTYMKWNGGNDSFNVSSPTVPGMIVSDGSTNQLILHSSGSEAQNTAGAMVGSDVATYISGAIGSAGVFKSFGATLFTGDIVVSGSADLLGGGTATFDDLYVNNHAGVSGSLHVGSAGPGGSVIFWGNDPNAYISWNSDGAEHGSLALGTDGYGIDFKVWGETTSRYMEWDQSTDTLYVNGAAVFNNGAEALDFRVESDLIPGMIIVDADTNQLILHSSGTDATTAKSVVGTDVATYISGAIGSEWIDGSVKLLSKGATLVTGDLVVSGTTHFGKNLDSTGYTTMKVGDPGVYSYVTFYGGDEDAVGMTWAGNTGVGSVGALFLGQDDYGVDLVAYGDTAGKYMEWDTSEDKFSVDGNVLVSSENISGMIIVDSDTNQLILHSSGTSAANAGKTDPGGTLAAGTDVGIYLSGAIGSAGAANSKGATLVAGDLVISGSTSLMANQSLEFNGPGGDQWIKGDGSLLQIDCDNTLYVYCDTEIRMVQGAGNTNIFSLQSSGIVINTATSPTADFRVLSEQLPGMIISDAETNQLILHSSGSSSANAGGSDSAPVGTDVGIYLSGAIGSVGADKSKGATLATGDLLVSGSISLFNKDHYISSTGAGLNFEGDEYLTFYSDTQTRFYTGGANLNALAILTARVNINANGDDIDFIVETPNHPGMIISDAGTNQLILHSSGTEASNAGSAPGAGDLRPAGSDVAIYLSGAVDSRGVANSKGVTLATGDLIVSGRLHGGPVDMSGDGYGPWYDFLRVSSGFSVAGGAFLYDGGSLTSTAPYGTDQVFAVSGSIGRKDTSYGYTNATGIAMFGGDLVVSGNTYLAMKKSGPGSDLALVGTDVNFFVSGSDGGKATGEGVAVFGGDLHVSGGLFFGESGGADIKMYATDSTNQLSIDGDDYLNLVADKKVTFNVNLQEALVVGSGFYGTPAGVVINEAASDGVDFRVESKTRQHALFVDSSTDQILLLSGAGGKTDPMESSYTDLAFFVSGSIGSAVNGFGAEQVGNGDLGVAVFGGDVVISGALFTPASTIYVGGAKLGSTPTGELLFLSGGAATDPNPADYKDTNFFVSGAISSMGSNLAGTAVFGGDLVVSGNTRIPDGQRLELGNDGFYLTNTNGTAAEFSMGGQLDISAGGAITLSADSNNGIQFKDSAADPPEFLKFTKEGGIESLESALQFHSADGYITMLSGSNNGPTSPNESRYRDMNFFVSGSIGSRQGIKAGTALFGGDVVVSGSFIPGEDNKSSLGSANNRWSNIYTGDLHLRNEKGSWTIQEEADRLIVINNMTGKRFKMALEPLEDEE